ncbi:MAG: hypothetical protein HQK50_13575 [Oligoflexia bacterium]|nr:hypothetical protein [Oligoflexia bacterium]
MNHQKIVLFILLSFCMYNIGYSTTDDERKAQELDNLKSHLAALKKYESELKNHLNKCGEQKPALKQSISQLNKQNDDYNRASSQVESNLIHLRIKKQAQQERVKNLQNDLREKQEALAKLLQEKHIYQNKKAALAMENNALFSAKTQLKAISDESLSLQEEIDKALDLYGQYSLKHQEWLKDFLGLTEKYAPEFKNITNLESYFTESKKINLFQKNTSSDENLKIDKKIYYAKIQKLDDSITQLQEKLRSFAGSSALAGLRYRGIDGDLLKELQQQDILLQTIRTSLAKSKNALDLLQDKRAYLAFNIPNTWSKLADARIIASSTETGAIAIMNANNALASGEFYGKMKSSLEKRIVIITTTFWKKYCPRLAKVELDEALKYVSELRSILPKLHLDPILHKAISALLQDYRRAYNLYLKSIDARLEEPEAFFNERKRLLNIKMNNHEKTNDACKERIKKHLDKDVDDLASEQDYVDIIVNC